jgi:hypothetical protein
MEERSWWETAAISCAIAFGCPIPPIPLFEAQAQPARTQADGEAAGPRTHVSRRRRRRLSLASA